MTNLSGDAGRLEILDPTAPSRVQSRALAPRHGGLVGRPIGFLSNKKANADRLLAEPRSPAAGRGVGPFEAVHVHKSAPLPAPQEVLARLSTCGAVVTAVAD